MMADYQVGGGKRYRIVQLYICGERNVRDNDNVRKYCRVDEDVGGKYSGTIDTAALEAWQKRSTMGEKCRGRAQG